MEQAAVQLNRFGVIGEHKPGRFNHALLLCMAAFTQRTSHFYLVTYQMLKQTLKIKFEVLSGKTSSGEFQQGEIIGLADKSAIYSSPIELETHSNIKFILDTHSEPESGIYAKVKTRREDGKYEITFTFVPREINKYFKVVLEAGQRSL